MEAAMRNIFLLTAVKISSAAEEVKHLTGIEGGSVILPDPVLEVGFVSFGTNIAMLNEGKIHTWDEVFKDKVLWNSNTGQFVITGLQRNDSGIYHINSKKGMIFSKSYKLTVYESVSTPAVRPLSVSPDDCTLQCFVEKAEATTLSWFKEEEIMNQSSSALSLPLTVRSEEFSSSYRCVAANPAENKTLPVNVTISCGGQNDDRDTDTRHRKIGIAIFIVSAVTVILAGLAIKWKHHDKDKRTHRQDSVTRQADVQYTDTQISEDKGSQEGNLPDSSGPVGCPSLTTVYAKLEAYRVVPDTAEHVSDRTFPHT